uniref:CCHC-type domain-containing protein n=1 Tax=Manihot esculenta TaxID=3983 RepID=A0A2C9V801_MANES
MTVHFQWYCLVGRILTERPINFNSFQHVLALAWKPTKGVHVKEMRNNVFLFQFFHPWDIDNALRYSPWNYQQIPILLHELKPEENPRQVELTKLAMWVQVHNVPLGFWSEKYAQDIGNFIGSFIAADPKNFTQVWHEYMCIRVDVDVRLPLKRKLQVRKPKGAWQWVHFKYEKLNIFCYFCGILGHTDRSCSKLFDVPNFPRDKFAYAAVRQPPAIGAKWLRSENDFLMEDIGGLQAIPGAGLTAEKDRGMQNLDKDPKGKSVDASHFQNSKNIESDPLASSSVHGKELFSNFENLDPDQLMVTEQKRRRMNELDVDIMDEEVILETLEVDPKNVDGAGSGFQSRLAQ